MSKSSGQFRIKQVLKWVLGLIGLLLAVFLGGIIIILRQNPTLMRFVPYGGLPGDYDWELREGFDFDVYYAESLNTEMAGVGLYLGNMANYFYDRDENLSIDELPQETGQLLSREVTWIIEDEVNRQEATFFRETRFDYYHGLGFLYTEVHIWIYAANQEELARLTKSLESLQLKPQVSFLELLVHRMGWW